ncbi:hypothetical protein BRC99_02940 [Halobacteriales archaeon QS_7_69_60]|nr:MAG: hypothetical protein BRC99_02940 [Halobacteriales archaeon QS_7_69_60]
MTGEADPTRVVADADVLAADLLVGGAAREALDVVRRHSWLELVATEELLAEATAVVAGLADADLADDWRAAAGALADVVEQPPDDHPALAAAYRGDAAQLLSFDDRLGDAFVAVFDPAAAYEHAVGESYPGPDRDPRA